MPVPRIRSTAVQTPARHNSSCNSSIDACSSPWNSTDRRPGLPAPEPPGNRSPGRRPASPAAPRERPARTGRRSCGASLPERPGGVDGSRPSIYQRISSLRSATFATIEPAIWCCAMLRQCGRQQVGDGREARAALRNEAEDREARSRGTARASSRMARISWLRFNSAGRLKSRSASRPRRFVGWRLAIATSRSSRRKCRTGRFCRRASSSRHSASRRAISRLRRPKMIQSRQPSPTIFGGPPGNRSSISSNSAFAQAVRPSCSSRSAK